MTALAPALESVELLDCTLRDGGYSVDFRFTASTIRTVLAGLGAAGVRYVELGHGLGLHAAEALGKPMLVPDHECFRIATEVATSAWGMFCIPGIARPVDLELAADHGMHFVRVGVDITSVEPAEEFLALARRKDLRTFANLMKTNLLDAEGVIESVQRCVDYGAETVYLVDSVGGYLPGQVAELVAEVRGVVGVPLGFHGHDNLGLATANALAAAGAGATWVDTTLDGIGRGAGNTITEAFAAILATQLDRAAYDYRELSTLSETAVRPLARLHDDRRYQLAGGVTQTHSSFFPLITRCAESANVDVFDLMAAVAETTRVKPTETLVERLAASLANSARQS